MRTDTYPARLVAGMLHRASLGVMLAVALLAGGCRELETIKEALTPATPHEAYAAALEGAGLNRTALGRDWLAASRAALAGATPVTLPHREVGYLDPAEASAVGYRLDLQRGQQLFVDVALPPGDSLQVFVDLFEVPEDTSRSFEHVASADSTYGLSYEVRRTRSYVLRVQPELLRGGGYTITLQTDGTLRFPVAGSDSRAIRSFFGAPRDGGRREHHGVDIFAARGTPVVAAADGYVTRVTTGRLGGKVVWMRDESRGQAYYYAHLDSQLVAPRTRVQAGDTLGLVGNTGNARTTPPHLHFGIYSRGPVDPYPFVHTPRKGPPDVTADTSRLGSWVRLTARQVQLRAAPGTEAAVLRVLPQYTVLRVFSGSEDWYRVRLPDGTPGFVAARLTEPADRPIRQARLAGGTPVRPLPEPTVPAFDSVSVGTQVAVLGRYDDFLYVASSNEQRGWIDAE